MSDYESLDRMVTKRRGNSDVIIHSVGCVRAKADMAQKSVRYCEFHDADACPTCHSECKICGRVMSAGFVCDGCEP